MKEDIESKKKDLGEKQLLLNVIKNRNSLQKKVYDLKRLVKEKSEFIEKIKNKPKLLLDKTNIENAIKELEETTIPNIEKQIKDKDEEITRRKKEYDDKISEKNELSEQLKQYKQHYNYFRNETQDIYEIEELLDISFESLHSEFVKTYRTFAGETGIRANRKKLKDEIARELNSDTQDIKQFIRDIQEEMNNLSDSENIIKNLLNSFSIEIGNLTAGFLTLFSEFKTFIRNYNAKLAEDPISNVQNVKVIIDENTDLIKDLKIISEFKFSDGLDFNNSYSESKKILEQQIVEQKGKPIRIEDLFNIKIEITKVSGEKENIDLSKQVQSKGTNIVLKLYLFLNILKDLVQQTNDNKIVVYIDELDSIGQKNVKHLISFCKNHNFVPIFAAPRQVEGIEKYYMIKEQKPKISFGENQANIVEYENAK